MLRRTYDAILDQPITMAKISRKTLFFSNLTGGSQLNLVPPCHGDDTGISDVSNALTVIQILSSLASARSP